MLYNTIIRNYPKEEPEAVVLKKQKTLVPFHFIVNFPKKRETLRKSNHKLSVNLYLINI